jgi:hypothetical protein
VTLGAFLADVPHTIPAPVSAASADPSWAARTDIVPARYEGPTGIVGVLNDLATKAGVPSVSLWAASPHYLPQTTNPKVAQALMERLRDLLDLEIDMGEVARSSDAWQREVTRAIDDDGNLGDYVRRLEEASEQGLGGDPGDPPSGEELSGPPGWTFRSWASAHGACSTSRATTARERSSTPPSRAGRG